MRFEFQTCTAVKFHGWVDSDCPIGKQFFQQLQLLIHAANSGSQKLLTGPGTLRILAGMLPPRSSFFLHACLHLRHNLRRVFGEAPQRFTGHSEPSSIKQCKWAKSIDEPATQKPQRNKSCQPGKPRANLFLKDALGFFPWILFFELTGGPSQLEALQRLPLRHFKEVVCNCSPCFARGPLPPKKKKDCILASP